MFDSSMLFFFFLIQGAIYEYASTSHFIATQIFSETGGSWIHKSAV